MTDERLPYCVERRVMPLDRNKTIHQRIAAVLQPVLGSEDAENLAKLLRPYVVAERLDAARIAMRPIHTDVDRDA